MKVPRLPTEFQNILGSVWKVLIWIKGSISDKYTPFQDSVIKRREKRQLEEVEMAGSSQENNSDFIPKNVFQKNQSPQLVKASWKRQIVYCVGPYQRINCEENLFTVWRTWCFVWCFKNVIE